MLIRHRAGLVLCFGGLTLALAACGSRGPLDLGDYPNAGDAAADAGPSTLDARADVAIVDATPTVDAEPDEDAAPEAGLINCGSCVAQTCGAGIVQCLTDTACRDVLTCVAQTCIAGGGTPDPQCIFTCAKGDTKAIATLVRIFTCVTDKCGPQCGDILSGLGGGGFPGGGG